MKDTVGDDIGDFCQFCSKCGRHSAWGHELCKEYRAVTRYKTGCGLRQGTRYESEGVDYYDPGCGKEVDYIQQM